MWWHLLSHDCHVKIWSNPLSTLYRFIAAWDIHLKFISNLIKSGVYITLISVVKSFWNFAQSMAVWCVHNIDFSCQIILKFCTEHGSVTAMLCAKYQNDWGIEKPVTHNFAIFAYKINFRGMIYIATFPEPRRLWASCIRWRADTGSTANMLTMTQTLALADLQGQSDLCLTGKSCKLLLDLPAGKSIELRLLWSIQGSCFKHARACLCWNASSKCIPCC